jgi:trigger factor
MQFNLEKLNSNFVTIEVAMGVEEVEEALAQSYKRVVNKVNLPGFRKGHVPRQILEAQYGKAVLFEDALDIIISKGYFKALEEFSLEPIDQPKLDVKEPLEEGKPFEFKATVEVLPEVVLGQYKGLEVEKPEVEIQDEQVDEKLKALQERHAELVLSEKEILEKGDYAVIDFEGYIDQKPFAGGAAQAYTLEIGSESFIPGFEEQLIGMKVGAEKEITVKFPTDYSNQDLAGKDASFKVSLREIKLKEIPVIDDEFAKSIGAFEDLEQLKADLREKITSMAERDAEANYAQAAIQQAVDNSKVELSETLVKREMEDLLHRFEHNLAYQGLNLEKFLTYSKKNREQVLEDFRPEAEKRVQTDLVLNAIAQAEKIEITDQELDIKIKELATFYEQKDPAKLKKDLENKGRLADIRQAILLEKTADFVKEQTLPKKVKK